jgi:hypothetical protein
MTRAMIASYRLANQLLLNPGATPLQVVKHMGAIQAQDYLASLWAIGIRMHHATEKSIEQAIVDRHIVRTWPMRGTIHFVPAVDAKWMVQLLETRIIARRTYRMKQLSITEEIMKKSRKTVIAALRGGQCLTRKNLYALLERAGIPTGNQRGLHILGRLADEALICFGPREGKQPTFVLFDEWVPHPSQKSREEALAEITIRYFTSHGPATIQDFMWWSGLTQAEVKEGIELSKPTVSGEVIDGKMYLMGEKKQQKQADVPSLFLLPAFDEYLVSYKDRSAVLSNLHTMHINSGNNGMLNPVVVLNGQVIGTWKRVLKRETVHIQQHMFLALDHTQTEITHAAVKRFADFLSLKRVTVERNS